MYDYGARFYDATVGRFWTQDAFAEKYHFMSPYQYGANNPILNVDINGDSIWIYDSNNQRQLYTAGMQYKGNDKFISSVVKYLNEMNSVKQGNQVLKSLIGSSNNFDFKNIIPIDKSNGKPMNDALLFNDLPNAYKNGGGEIQAGALMGGSLKDVQKVDVLSHELFHGYQRENNRDMRTINAEVEAYLFGRGVSMNTQYGLTGSLGFGIPGTPAGNIYDQSMYNLLLGGFTTYDYNNALSYFKAGSQANLGGKGKYQSHKISPLYKPIITKFLPF
jgi:hypothetical protein